MGQEPDEIRRDIETTRRRMDRTLDELEGRVSPRRIARRRSQRLRAQWADLKETMMGNADESPRAEGPRQGAHERTGERTQQAADTLRSAPGAARRRTGGNPLAAGAIAFGAGMLAASLLPRSRREQEMASEVTRRLGPAADEASTVGREIASGVAGSAREGLERTREAAADAADTVRHDVSGDGNGSRRSERGQVAAGHRAAERNEAGERDEAAGRDEAAERDEVTEPLEDRGVEELLRLAAERGIPGRSAMTRSELIEALRE